MSNSSLVSYTQLSPNCNNPRNNKILKITPHHMAGNLTLQQFGNLVANPGRQMSANYAIDSQGNIGLFCEEKNRSWCSSSPSNDHQAITIEVANSAGAPNWPVSDKALNALINLCEDICRRNGIAKLEFTGNANGNLTQHNYFASTACPGPYLKSKFQYIADTVNASLSHDLPSVPETPTESGGLYRVQVGAFSNKANASNYLAKIEASGFDGFLVESNGLYKVQVGAFKSKGNAEAYMNKVKTNGYEAIIVEQGGTVVPSTPKPPVISNSIGVGKQVKVKQSTKFSNGVKPIAEVYKNTYTVLQLNGTRAVIGLGNSVTGAMDVGNLILV